jgi:hypothetical protein
VAGDPSPQRAGPAFHRRPGSPRRGLDPSPAGDRHAGPLVTEVVEQVTGEGFEQLHLVVGKVRAPVAHISRRWTAYPLHVVGEPQSVEHLVGALVVLEHARLVRQLEEAADVTQHRFGIRADPWDPR